jgi:hypothetical protein
MRTWFIHPEHYDRKGLQAQWNESLILKNIIYGKKSRLTIDKLKKQQSKQLNSKSNQSLNIETGEFKPKGWVNHPHSKRVTRYKKSLQKTIINTYLYYLREYGVKELNINFNEKYLDETYIDHNLKIPILYLHIEKDYIDLLDKMLVRDKEKYIKASHLGVYGMKLLKPFYFTDNIDEYISYLDIEYLTWSDNNLNKLIGTEIIFDYENVDYSSLSDDFIKDTYKKSKSSSNYNYDTDISYSDNDIESDNED